MDEGFDYRWAKNPRPQATVRSTWIDKSGIHPEELAGKYVLDAGCGCGRNSKLLADAGAYVTGIDSSPSALQAAQENCPSGKFVLIDLLELNQSTFEPFDFVFSHGVLHHTLNPKRAFLNIAKLVKSKGQLNVWVYTKPCSDDLLPYHDLLHEITKACPPEALYRAIESHVLDIKKLIKENKISMDLQNILKVSNSDDDSECISDTYDWHCPQYRYFYKNEDVIGWFAEAEVNISWVGSFPVSVRGVAQ